MEQQEQIKNGNGKARGQLAHVDARLELGKLMHQSQCVRGKHGERVYFLTIPPELAQAVVTQLNEENPRRLNAKRVERYKRDQLLGHWKPNYDPLVFSADLGAWNGQHRLWAQSGSGAALTYLVVVDAPPDCKAAMDTGSSRSIAVNYGMSTRNSGVTSCMLVLCNNNRQPTQAEKAQFFDAHKGAIEAAGKILQRRKLTNRAPVMAAFAVAIERSGMPGTVEALAEDLASSAHKHRASRTISSALERTVAHDITARADQAMSLLRVIESHLKNDPVQIARPTTQTLRRWVPESGYRRRAEGTSVPDEDMD